MPEIPAEQAAREADLVERVVASFAATPEPRTRELVEALTRHLHAFVRETRLTEEEWGRAISFLTDVGHLSHGGPSRRTPLAAAPRPPRP